MRPTLLLSLALTLTPVLIQAQAPVQSSATATCTVRIRPRAAADYDPSTEIVLRGTVTEVQAGVLRLQLSCGTIRVEVGATFTPGKIAVGQAIEVTASKRQDDMGQHFVARELRNGSETLVLRDADGVPVGA